MSKDNDGRARAAKEFNKIIQEGRKKAKNEKLAAKIFGQKQPGGKRFPPASGSLASRVGVQKRYAAQRPNTARPYTNGAVTRSQSRLHQLGGGHGTTDPGGAGFNVRGMGMTVVVAQNFVTGTTAADIRAVFAPNKSQGLNSCRIISANPTVMAELVFDSQEEAEAVVARFNNKMADGRRLHVYLQRNPAIVRHQTLRPVPDVTQEEWLPDEQESMEVDHAPSKAHSAAGAGGADSGVSRPAPMFEDGKYGFGNQASGRGYDGGRYSDRSRDQQGGLVSDGMMQNYYNEDRRHYGRR